jgi:DNA helicase-2/ATP-dependent DNA helicase PcrA
MADPSRDIATVDTPTMELKVIYRYMEKQKKYFGLDFFDLINFTIYLFDHYADVLLKWQKRLHYVMVDEFQDITAKEFKQIRRLVAVNKNWFVVGDPDQNIYEWRGSNMQVLLGFDKPQDTPSSLGGMIPCETIFLNENYRSTPEICNASNSLIAKNINRIEKALFTKNQSGMPVAHYHGKNDADEIKFIVGKIEAHVKNGGRYSDCAVIYRSSFVSRFVEQGFIKYEIPYTVYGGVGFYERKEIKDVLSYLRLTAYGDDLSFKRVVNMPRRRMGKNKMAYLTARATAEKSTLYKTLKKHLDAPIFANSGARRFIQVIEDAKAESESMQVSELLQRLLIDSGYEAYVRESGEMERLENVAELIRYIVTLEGEYGEPLSLANFLQEASLGRDADDDRSDYVRIMTAHTAKGLEFHNVFIAGMSEKTFPSARALEERREDALEEERRLAYVAMTRAKKQLFISESEGFGFRGYSRTPSRFLFDIDDAYITRIGSISEEVLAVHKAQTVIRTPNAANVWAVGTHVKHKAFGEGVIEEVDALTQTYMIRFLNGIKPIRFGYQGMAEV